MNKWRPLKLPHNFKNIATPWSHIITVHNLRFCKRNNVFSIIGTAQVGRLEEKCVSEMNVTATIDDNGANKLKEYTY